MKKIVLVFSLLILCMCTAGQVSRIKGRVIYENSEEPVPFANILLKGTSQGVSCDSLGRFQLHTSGRPDTILVSAMGFLMQAVPLSPLPDQTLIIRLVPSEYNLNEVVIRPGENPAFEILRKAIAGKSVNNPDELESYEYTSYHKVEFDLNNFTENIRKNIFLRSFNFIFDNTDTTTDGVMYLPVLFNESASEVYYRKNPRTRKEIVNGRRSVGLKGPKIMKFTEDMYLYPNIYDNHVIILDKNFPSPLNDNYKSNYKFYLIDSLYIGDERCYHIQFAPRVKQDLAFTGEMFIEDSGYSVRRIDLQFSIEANVNFVRNYWIRQEYGNVDGVHNMIVKSQVIADFTVAENSKELTGFFGRKTSNFREHRINTPRDDDFYKSLDPVNFHDSSSVREESYWLHVRQDSLTRQEKSVFSMIDTLEQNRKFRALKNSVTAITTGYIPYQGGAIGNVYTFYSYNDVEHSRLKAGYRIGRQVTDKFFLHTYVAYGLHDERVKYHTEGSLRLSKKGTKITRTGAMLRRDASQPGRSSNMFTLDHLFNSLTNTGSNNFKSYAEEKNIYLERQWLTGLSTRLSYFHSTSKSFGRNNYWKMDGEGRILPKSAVTSSGVQLSARFASGERNLSAKFGDGLEALYFPKHPVISVDYLFSTKEFPGSETEYQKLRLRLEHKLRLKKSGYSLLRMEAGRIFGQAPWALLETPQANQIIFNDETAFNLMNYLEFVSDQYASLMIEHHFEGLLFNRLPLLNRLKWREFIFAKAYAGSLRTENENHLLITPYGISTLKEPYYESGFGIENIFKISRVDFIWRMNYREKPGVYYFIVKPSFYFKF